MVIRAQWAGHCLDAAKGVNKVWATAWGEDRGVDVYLAIWRHELGELMAGQEKQIAGAKEHFDKMVRAKQRKGYVEIGFESPLPEYVPSFMRSGPNEAITIARGGYKPFGRKGETDLPLVGLGVSLGADLDPDPVLHGQKFLDLLRLAGGDYSVRRLLLGYHRAKIRLEVSSEFGRRAAQRKAAAGMLTVLKSEMQIRLLS